MLEAPSEKTRRLIPKGSSLFGVIDNHENIAIIVLSPCNVYALMGHYESDSGAVNAINFRKRG